jgi:xanthine/uracil permease
MKKNIKFILLLLFTILVTILFKRFIPNLIFIPPVLFGIYVSKKFVKTELFEKIVRRIIYGNNK